MTNRFIRTQSPAGDIEIWDAVLEQYVCTVTYDQRDSYMRSVTASNIVEALNLAYPNGRNILPFHEGIEP